MPLKVLAVDDSKTIRMIVKKAFKSYDCELFEGENGVEGLAIAVRENPDLIILDITMPVMNGIEMLEKLKNEPKLKDIPVIMLTAESGKENVMQIVKMGVKDYIVKPFKGEQLIERTQNVIKLKPKKAEKVSEDTLNKYFSADGDIQCLILPEKVPVAIIAGIEGLLGPKIKEMASSGKNKLILDLGKIAKTNISLVKLIILIIENCQQSGVQLQVVGSSSISNELKEFQETSETPIFQTTEEAKAAF